MKILSPKGTADRSEWWITTLVSDLLAQLTGLLGIYYWSSKEAYGTVLGGILILFAATLLWITIAVTFKRLRDRGRPAWTMTLGMVPFIGWLWLIIECGFFPSADRLPKTKRRLVKRTIKKTEQVGAGDAEEAV
jgi:uncharacterized membrane protein YhaH (DUF805 family)